MQLCLTVEQYRVLMTVLNYSAARYEQGERPRVYTPLTDENLRDLRDACGRAGMLPL